MMSSTKIVKYIALRRDSVCEAQSIKPYRKYALNLRRSFSILKYTFEKNLMHDYDVHKALFLNCEIYCPGFRYSGSKAESLGHIVKSLLFIRHTSIVGNSGNFTVKQIM